MRLDNRRRKWLFITWLAALFLLACNVSSTLPNLAFEEPDAQLPSEPQEAAAPISSGDWYEIYFTNPECLPEEERRGGIDEIIAEDLLQATSSVDIAAFDLDSEPIVNALIELEKRGVPVRVVTDTDNEDLASIRRLRRNGLSVVTDDRSALMHDKFIVIDEEIVWTGSLNYTTNGVYCNNNNAVRFVVPELSRNYTTEMDEKYEDRSFGPRSPDNTPYKQFTVDGVRVDNYFASEEEVAPLIANLVSQAQESIQFMAFSFTRDDIGEAMLERAEAGVLVEGVFETTGSQTAYSYFPVFQDAGLANLQVLQDGNKRIMHHKVIIIDNEIVIFGSFNFSNNANDSNDENVVVVYDPAFARSFQEEFNFVWAEAEEKDD